MSLQEYAPKDEIVRNPSIFYKVGFTTARDAEERFSVEYHKRHGFEFKCFGLDYTPRCVWSAFFTEAEAKQREAEWLKFPKNLWLDEQYNGATECRFMDADHYKKVLNYFRLKYPKKDYGYKPGYKKVYLMEFTKIN